MPEFFKDLDEVERNEEKINENSTSSDDEIREILKGDVITVECPGSPSKKDITLTSFSGRWANSDVILLIFWKNFLKFH